MEMDVTPAILENRNKVLSAEAPPTFCKKGAIFRLRREVEAMDYVRNLSSIPISQVKEVHFHGGEKDSGWFLMERLPGCQLGDAWPLLNEDARLRMIGELRSYLEQLRQIRPPSAGWIGSCSGGSAYDHRFNNLSTYGPFATVADFNDFLVAPVKNCPRPEWVGKYRSRLPNDCPIVFAHADLSWENILVDPATGSVTGIVDWEMAGFWPSWWEYRKALFASRSQPWWFNIVNQIMPEHSVVTDVDMDLEMF